VILPQYSRDANARYRSFAGAFKSRFSETRFAELQASLGLCDDFLRSRTSVSALSGGERQRLALLRDISIAPDLLLLDEPCNGLDQSLKVELLQQLRRIVADHRVLVIYVSHHRDEVEMVADEIAVLEPAVASAPQRLCVGSASSVLEAPPSLLAAKLLAYPACNVVECYVQPGGILVPVSEQVTSAASSRTVCVAFGLDTARLHERGAKAMVVGQTAAITYVRLGRDGPVLAMRASASNGSRIHFDGPAWLFEDPKARAVAGTLLCCTKEPEACLRFRPS
jgi:ABC-type sugar transport system ATPase subunit